MSTFRIAACQMNSQNDKAANLRRAGELIDEAAALGAQMVGLPEMFNMLGEREDSLRGAEDIPGETSEFLAAKARQHGIYVHGGSIPVRADEPNKVLNSTLIFDPAGQMIARYDKLHLFDIHIEGQKTYKESDAIAAGNKMVTFETDHGNVGLSICYDIRFPELFRALTLNGARVIFLPAAFTLYTGKDHWETLIRARAIENQVYMVCPAQIGVHGNGRFCYGSSMIVDPWGTVLTRAPEREGVIVADIAYNAQDKIRQELPSLMHRRTDIYGQPG
ncbi:MAG: carbon-nitrogen hydrolase family protein [Ardenticatenaceae bacterium]|nr:carbon-nitrogen hydrolase family protein [Ardenticatenaceae bacterium]